MQYVCPPLLPLLIFMSTIYLSYHVTKVSDQLQHSHLIIQQLNIILLEHDDTDVYYLNPYDSQLPFHQYYAIDQCIDFVQRTTDYFGEANSNFYWEVSEQYMDGLTQQIVVNTPYDRQIYNWSISEGLVSLNLTDHQIMRQTLNRATSVQLIIRDLWIQEHHWNFLFVLTPQVKASTMVENLSYETLSHQWQHLPILILAISLALTIAFKYAPQYGPQYGQYKHFGNNFNENQRRRYRGVQFLIDFLPEMGLIVLMVYNSLASFVGVVSFKFIYIIDGVCAFFCWILISRTLVNIQLGYPIDSKQTLMDTPVSTSNISHLTQVQNVRREDYNITLVLVRSWSVLARGFLSMMPLFIGFVLFAYASFSKYTYLFSTLRRSFVSIFCVCYYNMTYEEFLRTQRAGIISFIYFFVLVLLFTICIYSGLLVSIFCSYVWRKKDNYIRQQILSQLQIQCRSCHHKYLWAEGKQPMPVAKLGFNLSTQKGRKKFIQILKLKVRNLSGKVNSILSESNQCAQGQFLQDYYLDVLQKNYQELKKLRNKIGIDFKTQGRIKLSQQQIMEEQQAKHKNSKAKQQ